LTVASPSYIKAHGKPRHPREIEECECIDFYDAVNARPYDWEMRRKKEVLPLRVKTRLLMSDSGTLIGACEAGAGIAQEIGCGQLLRSGRLVVLFPEWSDERFSFYAIYPSRLHRAAKVRAFIDFCLEIMSRN
jgi:DNA-binding transcriptional LysR family regulator